MTQPQQQNGHSFSVWNDLIAVCQERNCPPEIITQPEKFKGGIDAVRRGHVLKCLHAKGWREDTLLTLCPIDASSFYRSLKR